MKKNVIELLAPAKNFEYGKAAIDHGADAVYIGAPQFGARMAASNSVKDIGQLVRYAHFYRVKVYSALNTILYDHELQTAEKLIHELYQEGIDGLIIQDMGILEMNLPPVPLIASTQTHNTTAEKVRFLEETGFQRVILARELSILEISEIRRQTTVELESFVHGALCVSYSGQCYMSHEICGRSGNRGECAQPCRSAYDLIDSKGNLIFKNRHLISLKDLNLSAYLTELMEAGITSFKIEGRLKDISYVKNVTAYYRQEIDRILEGRSVAKSSSGKIFLTFAPDPERTFNRGFTTHNIEGRKEKTCSFLTQKSLGKKMGTVISVGSDWIIADHEGFSNGDGICFFDNSQNLSGTQINRVEGTKLFPKNMDGLKKGTQLYRNHDQVFEKLLNRKSSERKIALSLILQETKNGFTLKATDEDQNTSEIIIEYPKNIAEKQDIIKNQIIAQLSKSGNTGFLVGEVSVNTSSVFFIPSAILNQMRRDVIEKLEQLRIDKYKTEDAFLHSTENPYPEKNLSFSSNVSNDLALRFYRRHGVESVDPAFEISEPEGEKIVMTTKHCIRYQTGACPVHQKPAKKFDEPLFLKDLQNTFRLEFDCKRCVMKIVVSRKS